MRILGNLVNNVSPYVPAIMQAGLFTASCMLVSHDNDYTNGNPAFVLGSSAWLSYVATQKLAQKLIGAYVSKPVVIALSGAVAFLSSLTITNKIFYSDSERTEGWKKKRDGDLRGSLFFGLIVSFLASKVIQAVGYGIHQLKR